MALGFLNITDDGEISFTFAVLTEPKIGLVSCDYLANEIISGCIMNENLCPKEKYLV